MSHELIQILVESLVGVVATVGLWLLKSWKADHEARVKAQANAFESSIRTSNAKLSDVLEKFGKFVESTGQEFKEITSKIHRMEIEMAKQTTATNAGMDELRRTAAILSESVREMTRLAPRYLGEDAYKIEKKKG